LEGSGMVPDYHTKIDELLTRVAHYFYGHDTAVSVQSRKDNRLLPTLGLYRNYAQSFAGVCRKGRAYSLLAAEGSAYAFRCVIVFRGGFFLDTGVGVASEALH
jgi:hypothetical protein